MRVESNAGDADDQSIGTLPQTRLRWIRKGLRIACLFVALLPALWVLTHPIPVVWLRPVCKDTWAIVVACALAGAPLLLFRRIEGRAWSLSVIALIQAIFQAWCYNTGSHPARSPFQIWGIFPFNDAHLFYSGACELLNGQQVTVMPGARHPYPVLLAVLLKIFMHDFSAVTSVFTIVMALATWAAFEVIRLRLGGLTATVYLVCVTLYIRIHCSGLFMTEQLAVLYSLCAVALLVESIARQGKVKAWLYCGGLFFLTQALNARPAAYVTLPFLILATLKVFHGSLKARARMVVLSTVVVTISLLLHSITYYKTVASRTPSNVWYTIYGVLNGGTWVDGLKHSQELLHNRPSLAPSDWKATIFKLSVAALQPDGVQGLHLLRAECLSELRRHPGKLVSGWWRAVLFLWSKNTPFRATYAENPSVWFTESARWCTVLGVALSLFFLLKGKNLAPKFKPYQGLSWLNLAALLGIVASLAFAPPWDAGTRIFAATLPLFFLLPASGLGGLSLLIVNRFHEVTLGLNADSRQNIAIGSAAVIGGTLSLVIIAGSWCLVGTSSAAKNGPHPVRLMIDELTGGPTLVSSVDLRSLRAGYHLRLTDDTRPTWLPNISRKDFVQNIPRAGEYLTFSQAFNQLPAGSEVVVLPYWTLLVLDKEDAQEHRFTPQPEQMGHVAWPPVYFSKRLSVQNHY
jgi:hypothetical protein